MKTTPRALTGKQNRHLRALAHSLKPVVQIGKHGWTDATRQQVDDALDDHELIKVKVASESPLELAQLAASLETDLGAHVAQSIGSILVAYRPHPKNPKIRLPAASAPSES